MADIEFSISPLMRELLTVHELSEIQIHYRFLSSLTDGSRVPTTEDQRHFIRVAAYEVSPVSEFELLWCKYSQIIMTESKIASLKRKVDTLNEKLIKSLSSNTLRDSKFKTSIQHLESKQSSLTDKIDELKNKARTKSKAETKVKAELRARIKAKTNAEAIHLNEEEANLIIEKLSIDKDKDSIFLVKSLIRRVRLSHNLPPPITEPTSWLVCKSCGSDSPNLCKCSE